MEQHKKHTSCIDSVEYCTEVYEYAPEKWQEVKVLNILIMFFPITCFLN